MDKWRNAGWFLPAALLSIAGSAATARAADLPGWLKNLPEDEPGRFPDAAIVEAYRSCRLDVTGDGTRSFVIRQAFVVRQGRDVSHSSCTFSSSYFRKLQELKAWHRRADGRVESTDKCLVSQALGTEMYADTEQRVLGLEGTGPGSLFGFELSYTDALPGVSSAWWPARGDVPVLHWEFVLKTKDNSPPRGFWVERVGGTAVSADPEPQPDGGWVWKRKDVIGSRERPIPMEPAPDEEIPVFFVRYGEPHPLEQSWGATMAWFDEMSRAALTADPRIQELADRLTTSVTDPEARTQAISQFVRDKVRYVQIYLGDGGWRPHPAGLVLEKLYGDCKDMSHLLVALLRASGVNAWPVLTNAASETGFRPEIPSPCFDHCIVVAELPESPVNVGRGRPATIDSQGRRFVFIDPTAKQVAYGWIPEQLEDRWALFIGVPVDTPLVRLPRSNADQNLRYVEILLTVKDAAYMTGVVRDYRLGRFAFATRQVLAALTPEERRERQEAALSATLAGVTVEALESRGLEQTTDSLVIAYRFRSALPVIPAGDLMLLAPNPITATRSDLFRDPKRDSDMVFDYPYLERTELRLRLPPGWAVQTLPAEVMVENRVAALRAVWERRDGEILLHRTEAVRQARWPAADYNLAREWSAAMYGADQERVPIKVP
jgi:hypothetical protein